MKTEARKEKDQSINNIILMKEHTAYSSDFTATTRKMRRLRLRIRRRVKLCNFCCHAILHFNILLFMNVFSATDMKN